MPAYPEYDDYYGKQTRSQTSGWAYERADMVMKKGTQHIDLEDDTYGEPEYVTMNHYVMGHRAPAKPQYELVPEHTLRVPYGMAYHDEVRIIERWIDNLPHDIRYVKRVVSDAFAGRNLLAYRSY